MYSKRVAPRQAVLPFEIIIEILSLLTVESLLRFNIRNPATRQVLYLPDAPKGTRILDLALNSLTGDCKVASIYRKKAKKTGYLVGLEVITIGKDEKWRPLKYSSPNLLKYGQWLLQQSCCVKDKVEWIVHLPEIIKHGQDLCVQIQSLEPWSERVTNTVLPRGVYSDLTKVHFFFGLTVRRLLR
ncbi:hypothetical protein TB1_036283 [Malus domestica]